MLVLSVAALPSQALACMCRTPDSLETEFKKASVVVAAEAISITAGKTAFPMPNDPNFSMSTQIVEWEVTEAWKGSHTANKKFTTEVVDGSSLCLITVNKGDVYILYLTEEEPYTISSCSRSRLLKDALKDVPTLYKLSNKIRRRT